MKEELGIDLDPEEGVLIHQKRRDKEKDFYDVWLFRKDIPIEELILQPTEVVQAKWVDKEELCRMYSEKILHPLIDYINVLP